MNPTNLSFCLSYNSTLTLMKLFPLPSGSTSMHQREGPVNTLECFLWALIIQRIFSIPTDSLLLVFLQYSRHLREFCGFDKVPDASKITRFKQDFLEDLQAVFNHLVDLTEPICQAIDSSRAAMTIFDSSGIEAWVTENNPKYANRIIRQLKSYAKAMHFDKTMTLTKLLTVPCFPCRRKILISNSFSLMGIFVMPTNLALSQMVWALSGILTSITRIFLKSILRLFLKRSPIPG